MRILHVAGMDMGGIHVLIRELTEHQVMKQHLKVGILIPTCKGINGVKEIAKEVNVYALKLKSWYDLSIKKYYRMYKIFKNYDIIHFHEFHPFYTICALLTGKKIIHTEHGTFQRRNLKISIKKYIKKRVLGYFFLEHFYSAVVFNSNWLKEDVNLKTKKTYVIQNGTHFKGSPKITPKTGNTLNILTICRLVPRKRVDRLIRAVAKLDNLEGVCLHIVGGGPLSDELINLSKRLLQNDTYLFYGFQSDVSRFYDLADIFVLPAQFEPFGLVVVEAIRSGLISICFSDSGGALEIIQEVHEKLIAGDETELAEHIQYWRDNREERLQITQKLNKRILEHFTVERMAEDYQRLYFEVLNDEASK